ncbi:glycoside hydrolase family 18 protein [Collybiopsis luxurians FD-317 M1]|nr:glycoside hydrolase family 18 protein [Collybiopsis luxurians FD-317 M1]
MAAPVVTINTHTTASSPRPHILYTVQVSRVGEKQSVTVNRRYSEFVALHNALQPNKSGVSVPLPPKRILVTSFIPSAWLDDVLIKERKSGLAAYLSALVAHPKFSNAPELKAFLSQFNDAHSGGTKFDLEDAVPSTLSRSKALDLKAQLLGAGEVRAEATMIAAAYYPDWSASEFPPENLNYTRFSILFYAFAIPNSSSTINWDSGAQGILTRLVTAARNSGAGTKIVLSVGGWGGSTYFSQCVANASNRNTFVNTLVSAVNSFGLDGIDIDWEYPNSVGAGNINSPADAANLLTFLTQLRSSLGSSKIISAAVPDVPWLGSNGSPLTNVSAYAAQMTYLNLMNYDVFQSSSTPGPNAPLGNLCGTSSLLQYSAQAALSQWSAAGFPASKMLLGLPLYGYVSNSTKTTLTGSFVDPSEQDRTTGPTQAQPGNHARVKKPISQLPESGTNKDQNGVQKDAANANLQSWYGQQIPFSSIVASGALVKNSDGTYSGGGGFTEGWDNCSDTPFLFNTSQSTVVTYDDTFSLGDKATFARQNGMAGCFTWSLDQDDGVTLQNVIRSNLGLS